MDSAHFHLRHREDVVQIDGELDLETAPDLLREVSAVDGPVLTFDLSGMTFIDSSGIAVLLQVRREHPSTRIIGASSSVRELFRFVGVEQLLLDDPTPQG